jgi:hypothetical protein
MSRIGQHALKWKWPFKKEFDTTVEMLESYTTTLIFAFLTNQM